VSHAERSYFGAVTVNTTLLVLERPAGFVAVSCIFTVAGPAAIVALIVAAFLSATVADAPST
jgi:hypothetical protein